MTGGNIGYVYIMRATNNPKELKIGWATSVEEREKALFQTGMAHPLQAIFYVAVDDPYGLEQSVHDRLQTYRVIDSREFFSCDVSLAIDSIRELCRNSGRNIYKEYIAEHADIPSWVSDIAAESCERIKRRFTLLLPRIGEWKSRIPGQADGKIYDLQQIRAWRKEYFDLLNTVELLRWSEEKEALTKLQAACAERSNQAVGTANTAMEQFETFIFHKTWYVYEMLGEVAGLRTEAWRGFLDAEQTIIRARRSEFDKDLRIIALKQSLKSIDACMYEIEQIVATPPPSVTLPEQWRVLQEWLARYWSISSRERIEAKLSDSAKAAEALINAMHADPDCQGKSSREYRVSRLRDSESWCHFAVDEHIDEYAQELLDDKDWFQDTIDSDEDEMTSMQARLRAVLNVLPDLKREEMRLLELMGKFAELAAMNKKA